MNDNDEERYRDRAEECRVMAENARSSWDKEAWLKLAADWLSLAEQREAGSRRFEAMVRERTTGQVPSKSSH